MHPTIFLAFAGSNLIEAEVWKLCILLLTSFHKIAIKNRGRKRQKLSKLIVLLVVTMNFNLAGTEPKDIGNNRHDGVELPLDPFVLHDFPGIVLLHEQVHQLKQGK
jgi:hypothetical protein